METSNEDSIETSPTTCKWLPNETSLPTNKSLWTSKLLEISSEDSIEISPSLLSIRILSPLEFSNIIGVESIDLYLFAIILVLVVSAIIFLPPYMVSLSLKETGPFKIASLWVIKLLEISSEDSIETSPTTCKWLPNDASFSTNTSLWTSKLLEISNEDSMETSPAIYVLPPSFIAKTVIPISLKWTISFALVSFCVTLSAGPVPSFEISKMSVIFTSVRRSVTEKEESSMIRFPPALILKSP